MTGPQAYPDGWASIKTEPANDGCPNLTGTYADRADGFFPQEVGTPSSLSEIFTVLGAAGHGAFHGSWGPIHRSTSVSFDETPEDLNVKFIQDSDGEVKVKFQRVHLLSSALLTGMTDMYRCHLTENEPRLRLFNELESHSSSLPGLYIEGGGTLVYLLKAADGSLVVQLRAESLGFSIVILPAHMKYSSVWFRYPLLEAHH